MSFGQLVIGPAGCGKTTYCNGMQHYLRLTGREVSVINLDPANDKLPYDCTVDIGDLVTLDAVMDEYSLGPNGGLLYCMEYLEQNLDWLQAKLEPLQAAGNYLIFDCPGQVELFSIHDSTKAILDTLTGKWHLRLAAVQLVDAHLCTDAAKYMSALLLCLSTMLHLELPHVNLLSKMDLLPSYGPLPLNLDFYTEVQDLSYLTDAVGPGHFSARFRSLTEGLCQVVEDFALLRFLPLAIEDKDSMQQIVAEIDKATGYVFVGLARSKDVACRPEFQYSAASQQGRASDITQEYQEKYVSDVQESEVAGLGALQSRAG